MNTKTKLSISGMKWNGKYYIKMWNVPSAIHYNNNAE